jgi:hypothetical protein
MQPLPLLPFRRLKVPPSDYSIFLLPASKYVCEDKPTAYPLADDIEYVLLACFADKAGIEPPVEGEVVTKLAPAVLEAKIPLIKATVEPDEKGNQVVLNGNVTLTVEASHFLLEFIHEQSRVLPGKAFYFFNKIFIPDVLRVAHSLLKQNAKDLDHMQHRVNQLKTTLQEQFKQVRDTTQRLQTAMDELMEEIRRRSL